MRSRGSLSGRSLDGTNRPPAVAAGVVFRDVAARPDVEAPRAAVVVRARHGRPVDAVRTGIVERSPVAVPSAGEKDAISRIFVPTANDIAFNTIDRCPSPVTLTIKVVKLLPGRHPPFSTPMCIRRVMFWRKHTIRCYPTLALQC